MEAVCPAVKHSLKFFFTACVGVPNLPDMVSVAMMDGVQMGYCDSSRNIRPTQNWVKSLLQEDPQQVDWYRTECFESQPNFLRDTMRSWMHLLNQTGGQCVSLLCSNLHLS